IAHQSQIGTIDHRPTLFSPTSVRTVAMRTIRRIDRLATFEITGLCACRQGLLETIGRKRHTRECLRTSPPVLHPINQDVNLFVCQSPARVLRESGHGCAWHALGDNLPQGVWAQQREIEWVAERACCSQLPVAPVAAGAGAAVEFIKVAHLGGQEWPLCFRGLPRHPITAEHQAQGSQTYPYNHDIAPALHGACSCSGSIPGASSPARAAIGQVCIVSICSERAMTKPPIIPKATCE